MLDLSFTDDQEMLRQAVRDLLEKDASNEVVREMEDDPVGYPAGLWASLRELDLVGLLLPEDLGGADGTLLDGVVLYEEFGRALAPVPHLESAVICGGLLRGARESELRSTWLPKVASGESIWTLAWLEPESGFMAAGIETTAGASISGVKRHVTFAGAAERLIVIARGQSGEIEFHLVDPEGPGVTRRQQFSIGSSSQYEVLLDGAPSEGVVATGWEVFEDLLPMIMVLRAAHAVGGARRVLEMTVQYAKDRHQFDKPLGAFQSIAHYLSDQVTAIDGAEQLVHEAAWALEQDDSRRHLPPAAKLFAEQTYRQMTAVAQQIFGGIGFTVELDLQLYFRRAKEAQLSWCDARDLEERIATAILD